MSWSSVSFVHPTTQYQSLQSVLVRRKVSIYLPELGLAIVGVWTALVGSALVDSILCGGLSGGRERRDMRHKRQETRDNPGTRTLGQESSSKMEQPAEGQSKQPITGVQSEAVSRMKIHPGALTLLHSLVQQAASYPYPSPYSLHLGPPNQYLSLCSLSTT